MEPVDSDELPPGRSRFSKIATDAPESCAAMAAERPQAPAPMTRISMSCGIRGRSNRFQVASAAGLVRGTLREHCCELLDPRRRRCLKPSKSWRHGRIEVPRQGCDFAAQLLFAERIVRPAARAIDVGRDAAAIREGDLHARGPILGPGLDVLIRQ